MAQCGFLIGIQTLFSTYGISGTSEAAKEIEKLIIQEKISYLKEAKDLLDRAYKFNNSDMGWDVDYETWKENYEQLTTELNKLNN